MVSYLVVTMIAHDDVKKAKEKISAHHLHLHLHLHFIFTFLHTFSASLIAATYTSQLTGKGS